MGLSISWDDNLLPEQRRAACHHGCHARLIAGPGTGKTLTLTRRACYLVKEEGVTPQEILAVTFTRAAARELRQRVSENLSQESLPRVSTLHSYSLRQLLKNSSLITALPQPLRIADDWEERNIILEDLKLLLKLSRISEARSLLNDLSADWQSLKADQQDWETRFVNPRFLGAWREHRGVYGYTLRSELVYQLKHALEERADFELEGAISHLLVDEYQDLNRCDLEVITQIVGRGVELFAAGDDDQSVYGFRRAHPEGIRRFTRDYPGAASMALTICKRCDKEILDFGLFVAEQDHNREPKAIESEGGREGGDVRLLRFSNQEEEARVIAAICRHLISEKRLAPDEILVLLRSDHNGVFSSLLRRHLEVAMVPVVAATEHAGPFDSLSGRVVLAFLRLVVSRRDHLAWRTLFQVQCKGIGSGAIGVLYDLAKERGSGFAGAVLAAAEEASSIPSRHSGKVGTAMRRILNVLGELVPEQNDEQAETGPPGLDIVQRAVERLVEEDSEREAIMKEFQRVSEVAEAMSLEELVRAVEISSEDIEQEIEEGKVNILTMHKAKGLTAEAVIVVAAEDEYIPGRAVGDAIGDERRLLYVSLTRARHHLFVTFCNRRTGPQRYTGRDSGRPRRSLTKFLSGGPISPVDGRAYVNTLTDDPQ